MSKATVLIDLPIEDDETAGRDVAEPRGQMYMVAGRILTYFEELDNWCPVVCPIQWHGPLGIWVFSVKTFKDIITSEFSQYYFATVNVHTARGCEKYGEALADVMEVPIVQWLIVSKAPPQEGAPVENPAAAITKVLECPVFLHDQGEWKPITMPNREGPTAGRLFTSIRMLKVEVLKAFGYNVESYVNTVRFLDIKVYNNDSGKATGEPLPNNTRIVNGRWYSMTVACLEIENLHRAPNTPDGESWENWDEVESQKVCEEDLQ